ncbi:MAG: DNA repair protein RecN [Gammaproteobacteria bacterium]|nr:MAG: DNA repair protein RecN [Gammaproteobacteria bacterium]
MLTGLSIRHFTLVDSLDIEFAAGLTVITGETGAGKSLLVDALGQLLGDRADTRWVRSGAERATLSATFDVRSNAIAQQWLKERALDEGHECLLRRVLMAEGGSKAWINGQPATLQDLRELGDLLVDLHAQHEHQSLLRRDTQRALLDAFGGHTTLASEVAALARQWREQHTTLERLKERAGEASAREELLRFQLQELEKLAPEAGEFERLSEQQKSLANAEALLEAANTARTLCDDDDSSANRLLRKAQQALERLPHRPPALEEARKLLESATIHLDEASTTLQDFCDSFDADPAALAALDKRLDRYHELARKHRVPASELCELQQRLGEELTSLDASESRLDALEKQLAEALAAFTSAAGKLSKARQKAAKTLCKAINALLADVGLPNARIDVGMEPLPAHAPDSRGAEDIDLLVQTNPGMPMDKLARIASGGELSRISLAINVVTAQSHPVSTLVFDEVDVGIGGQTASQVGHLLRALGQQAQVLCVTHQPQVAACGHQHLQVSKSASADSTVSAIDALTGKAREEELARMLGGKTITEKTRAHARELLESA